MNLVDRITCKNKCEELKNYYAERIIKECIINLYHTYHHPNKNLVLPDKRDKKDGLIKLDSLKIEKSRNGKYWIEGNNKKYLINADNFKLKIEAYKKYDRFNKYSFLRLFGLLDINMDYFFLKKINKNMDNLLDNLFCTGVILNNAIPSMKNL